MLMACRSGFEDASVKSLATRTDFKPSSLAGAFDAIFSTWSMSTHLIPMQDGELRPLSAVKLTQAIVKPATGIMYLKRVVVRVHSLLH